MNPHRSRPSARVGVISRKVEAQEVPRIGGGGTSERWPSAKDQDKKLNANAQPDGLPMLLVKSALRYPFLRPGRRPGAGPEPHAVSVGDAQSVCPW